MTTTTQLITAEQLWEMPSEQRCELVRGELRTMAPAGFDHGATTLQFGRLLGNFVIAHKLGVVVGAETGFRLSRNPDTVRGVDVGFVKAERISTTGRPVKYWEGAPDLAAEVTSPSDTMEEVEEKVDEYLAAGSGLIIVVNSRRKTVTVNRPGQQPIVLREGDTLEGYDVVPGFRCDVREIFA